MTKRHISAVSLSAIVGLLLTQFQNCAPVRNVASGGETVDYTDNRVGVDVRNTSDLRFALARVEVRDEAASAAVGGLCARANDGGRVKLSLVDGARSVLSAEGTCTRGQFQVRLDDMDALVCGVTHQLVAEGEWGGSATVNFVRRCQPVMSEAVDAADSPFGTTCEMEYTPGDGPLGCQRVCYRLDQVINVTALDRGACAGLATKLAGP